VSIAIRPALSKDCSALFGLIADHARFERSVATLTPSDLMSILAHDTPPVTIFVGARGCELLGFAAVTFDLSLWRARRWAHLDCLFVREDARGLGLGTVRLEAAVDHAATSGADRMEWQTPTWNERAIAFYRRAGAEMSAKVRFTLLATQR
jgi:GNAT superfamily N-acetyltransferase